MGRSFTYCHLSPQPTSNQNHEFFHSIFLSLSVPSLLLTPKGFWMPLLYKHRYLHASEQDIVEDTPIFLQPNAANSLPFAASPHLSTATLLPTAASHNPTAEASPPNTMAATPTSAVVPLLPSKALLLPTTAAHPPPQHSLPLSCLLLSLLSAPPIHSYLTHTSMGLKIKPCEKFNLTVSTPPTISHIPKSVRSDLKYPNWHTAVIDEFHALVSNNTWNLVHPPSHANIVSGKCIFRHKLKPDGSLE